MKSPNLYGIESSNRTPEEFWGKNMFNSSFPVALANYMRDTGIKANYIKLDKNLNTYIEQIDISELYNADKLANNELYFEFESKFQPYQQYSYDVINGIDLVVKDLNGNFLRPLEVKLTVVPDNSTVGLDETKWGSEIVIRPATTSYCALGMAHNCKDEFDMIRDIFEPECRKVETWSNSYEINTRLKTFLELMNVFQKEFYNRQVPLIMQPIWKTRGQSPILDNQALDIFVWSDYAFSRIFLESPIPSPTAKNKMSRQMRSTARLVRFLYEVSKSGKVHLNEIYAQMTFNFQTDKEFSANGGVTHSFMKSPRLINPIVTKDEIENIILNGGEKCLRPERRFDQSIYFNRFIDEEDIINNQL